MANYFTRKELECRCCGKCLISDELLSRLNQAREMAGIPFVITSGYRCEKHNEEVGGKPTSAHMSGKAVDIAFKTSNQCFKIVKALYDSGFKRIGINFAKSFVHCDVDGSKPQNVLFKY